MEFLEQSKFRFALKHSSQSVHDHCAATGADLFAIFACYTILPIMLHFYAIHSKSTQTRSAAPNSTTVDDHPPKPLRTIRIVRFKCIE